MKRILQIAIAYFCMTTMISVSQAEASKHAVLIYDADMKRVMYEENGYAKRYPASLTKMMTLYMLFEQLRAGNITPRSRMKASARAASQPQTNISLKKGDTLSVDQAIRALVVRSANDVAVVVAEYLGGSEARFARMATSKARALGMRNTTFKNAHGLPNRGQVTTALDMAILGAALRRDFPQYYNYFTTKKFSFKGKHFKSHNRVLDKLPGIDGIKTGYIRASGFNLVSSLKTRHSNVVAVVLGGESSKERDARMVSLLRVTQNRLAGKREGTSYKFAGAPIPEAKPVSTKPSPSKALDALIAKTIAQEPVIVANAPIPVPKPLMVNAAVPLIKADITPKPKVTVTPVATPSLSVALSDKVADNKGSLSISLQAPKVAKPAPVTPTLANLTMPKKNTLDYQLAALSKEFPVPAYIFDDAKKIEPGKGWGVQIGVFKDTLGARRALSQAARMVRKELQHAVADVEYAENGNRGFHRARLKNLSKDSAQDVCSKLIAMSQDCFVVKM